MGAQERFFEYALEFEKTFVDDDWSRLERFFTPDVVYEVRNAPFACRIQGRDAILRGIKKSLDGFDRRMKGRTPSVVSPPVEENDGVSFAWTVTYTKDGAPDFVLKGRSTAHYRGEQIDLLIDEYPDEMTPAIDAWQRAYAPDLDVTYV